VCDIIDVGHGHGICVEGLRKISGTLGTEPLGVMSVRPSVFVTWDQDQCLTWWTDVV
jgi:hypothetical protein